ncbi:lasso peptide biosynthesis B2 protein [Paraflavisolibacter sp. H34]|uniref:lasso peptide biosynthesis B2 protein n=1 Tax=Huijunlia imazamoxiresistens TaxID=3127457 RepID=UPI0030194696
MKMHKAVKFWRGSFRFKILLLEAFFWLLASKLMVRFVPLKAIAQRMGTLNGERREVLSGPEKEKSGMVQLAVNTVCSNVPWKSVCLDQALACMFMLKRRKIPYSLCLGTIKNETRKALDAHAWVLCGTEIIMGGTRSKKYALVAYFSRTFL